MRKLVLAALFFLLLFPASAQAEEENNKFGIHLAVPSEEGLEKAATLVNSSGGDWGYVTLVIEEKDRDREKWRRVFDKMRQLHLIPIIRLATFSEGQIWHQPEVADGKPWAQFLDSLNWVVKERFVILFNEPNHSAEWGGKVDPADYGQVALAFAKELKVKNENFYLMLSGFDAAAPAKTPQYEDEEKFLTKMVSFLGEENRQLFDLLSGWASHSYPNPGFIGLPLSGGRNSVRGYQWELLILAKIGWKKEWPVFITETGWPHAEGLKLEKKFYPAEKTASYFRTYLESIGEDSRVRAITPFILNYQEELFDHFSWIKPGSEDFYPQYETVLKMSKMKGIPIQEQKIVITGFESQKLLKNSVYQFTFRIRNEGQAIWDDQEGYGLNFEEASGFEYFFSDFWPLFPFEEKTGMLFLKTGGFLGRKDLKLWLTKNGERLGNFIDWSLEVLPAPKIHFQVRLWPKKKTNGEDFKMVVYNLRGEVIFEADKIKVEDSKAEISEATNLVIGQKYRLVILKPYYLPRQEFIVINESENRVFFRPMFALDFNLDGKFSLKDIGCLFKNFKLLKNWWIK